MISEFERQLEQARINRRAHNLRRGIERDTERIFYVSLAELPSRWCWWFLLVAVLAGLAVVIALKFAVGLDEVNNRLELAWSALKGEHDYYVVLPECGAEAPGGDAAVAPVRAEGPRT
jgi:hypothetical protein